MRSLAFCLAICGFLNFFPSGLRLQIRESPGTVDEFCFNISIDHCYPHHYSLPTVLHRNSAASGTIHGSFFCGKLIFLSYFLTGIKQDSTKYIATFGFKCRHRFPVGINLCFSYPGSYLEFCLVI